MLPRLHYLLLIIHCLYDRVKQNKKNRSHRKCFRKTNFHLQMRVPIHKVISDTT